MKYHKKQTFLISLYDIVTRGFNSYKANGTVVISPFAAVTKGLYRQQQLFYRACYSSGGLIYINRD